MLVLSRKLSEEIHIINEKTQEVIVVTVLDVSKNGASRVVKLGFEDSQKNYKILRKEVLEREKNNASND